MFSWLVSPWKDVNSLPEIKLQDNEEIIFSNYKINALDEGHTTWNQKLAFYYCTITNKAFYFLILRKLHPEVKFFGQVLQKANLVEYEIDIKKIRKQNLVVGFADGSMKVDGKEIYTAKNLKVGLFKDPSGF